MNTNAIQKKADEENTIKHSKIKSQYPEKTFHNKINSRSQNMKNYNTK
jgi:hypothetical protein